MKKTCENCYNNVMPRVGRIAPMDECLENNPEYGKDTSGWWNGNGKNPEGIVCPHWVQKMKRW